MTGFERDGEYVTASRTVLYLGTYERDYPRNQQLIRLLKKAGCQVVEIHQPFWEDIGDKSRGLNGITGMLRAGLTLLKAYLVLLAGVVARIRRADAAVFGYIGQLDVLVLGPLLRLCRIPVIFNPLVTLTDTVIEDRGLVRKGTLAAGCIWFIDRLSLRLASAVVVDTPQSAEYLTRRFGVPTGRTWVIDIGADETVFSGGSPHRPDSRQLHVLYYGKMIPLHGIETILETIERLHCGEGSNASFEIIGSGQLEGLVQEFRERYPGAPVDYRPWVAYSRLPRRIACADVVLGVFGSGDKAARVVPNKVYQAMAMGAAIITRDSPAARRVLRDEESALLIPPGDPDALADAIRRLRDDGLRGRLGRNARAAFEQWGSDAALSVRVHSLLDQIVPMEDEQCRVEPNS